MSRLVNASEHTANATIYVGVTSIGKSAPHSTPVVIMGKSRFLCDVRQQKTRPSLGFLGCKPAVGSQARFLHRMGVYRQKGAAKMQRQQVLELEQDRALHIIT